MVMITIEFSEKALSWIVEGVPHCGIHSDTDDDWHDEDDQDQHENDNDNDQYQGENDDPVDWEEWRGPTGAILWRTLNQPQTTTFTPI